MSDVSRTAPHGPDRPEPAGQPLLVAVTGGIGAGKSTVATGLAGRGAIVVDSDRVAREVVEPGTQGLAEIVAAFGAEVLTADGALDRTAMAGLVFADPDARAGLERIIHPLVRREVAARRAAAPPDAVVVNDIPLLRDLPTAATYHLVIGVGAADDVRLDRLVARGHTAADALARIAAQIDDDERRPLCDVWVENTGDRAALAASVDLLWRRLHEFAGNRLAGRRAARGPAILVGPDPAWPAVARLVAARVAAAAGFPDVAHIGSTAVPGLPAKDVIDLQLTVPDLATADRIGPALADAGFPRVPGVDADTPHPPADDPDRWRKRLHASADPGRPVNLHIRAAGSPGERFARLFPAWLAADGAARGEYLAVKRAAAAPTDRLIDDYALAKEPWLVGAYDRALAWAEASGWGP